MGKRSPDKILKRAEKERFESVWEGSTQLLPETTRRLKLVSGKRGVSHPLFDLLQKMRQSSLSLGFMEVSNPIVVDEKEVYKQYESEAPIILAKKDVDIHVMIAKRPSYVNIRISDVARRYITSRKRKIDIAGPIFTGVRAEIAKA